MITHKRTGGRTIELFLPFEHEGVKVKEIVIAPVRLDHTLRWQDSEYKTILSLLSELSGLSENALRQLAYPDSDRVMDAFVNMLPPEIKNTVANMVAAAEDEKAPQTTVATVDTAEPDAQVNGKLGRELLPGEPPPPEREDGDGLGLDLDGQR